MAASVASSRGLSSSDMAVVLGCRIRVLVLSAVVVREWSEVCLYIPSGRGRSSGGDVLCSL